ncbi:MAG: ATP-grasp domain-containing protein [Lachnospiraceae bacterium]|nr:ATP-grasp domain-containing protein [Lachnospiraceae bacterium]
MVNILILSAGTRDKVVQYFKKELGDAGKVIATDCSELAPAIYEADEYVIVPRIDAPDYLDIILNICKEKKITGVFSLIDPELSLLAKHREKFLAVNTTPIISDYDKVETCFDKFKMYEKLQELGVKTGRCFMDAQAFFAAVQAGQMQYPVFLKPVCGSASLNINKVNCKEEVELLCKLNDDLMIQEFMNGQEYGADVYIDMISGEVISIFVKKKIKMRAGETDKSVSVKDEALFDLIKGFVEKMGFRGIIDIDIFNIDGQWYISEVNPRFGGGYPHAYACGVNVPKMIINNLKGIVNEPCIGAYRAGTVMMKFNEIMIKEDMGDCHG